MRPFLFAVVIAAVASLSAQGGDMLIQIAPPGWNTRLATPVFFHMSDATGEMSLTMRGGTIQTRDRFALSGLPSEMVEATMYARHMARLEWTFDGTRDSEYRRAHSSPQTTTYLCLDGAMYRDLADAIVAEGDKEVYAVPATVMPRAWQSYAGLSAVFVMDGKGAQSLSRDQREALRQWVLWSAGVVWIVGGDGLATVREWGWQVTASDDPDLYTMGMGTLRFADNPDASALVATRYARERDVLDRLVMGDFRETRSRLTGNFQGISTLYIVVCLVALGLILGPVNYWLSKRLGSMLYFFALTPLAAVLGSAAILGGTVVVEGGLAVNEISVLYGYGDDSLMISAYGVRPGLLTPQLDYPSETLLVPEQYMDDDALVIDRVGGVSVREGLLRPRLTSEFGTARPLKGRMTVAMRDGRTVENTLGFDLRWVVASDGQSGWARDVPAGATVHLETSRVPEDIAKELRDLPGYDAAIASHALVARAAGLPYLDDGGLGARRLFSAYYYVGLDAKGGDDE